MAKKQFKAESKRLLDLMINSIYTHKEIFLRELISNASDASDKFYYNALSEGKSGFTREDLAITLAVDKAARTLTVTDRGCGMSKEDLENNLGTIAKSGSLQFKAEHEGKDAMDIIGQFGVGFYAAFMVSKKVTVLSRADGAEEAWLWASEGVDGYTVTQADKPERGTVVTLWLKDDTEDEKYGQYLDQWRLAGLVKKYSDYIRYPIRMEMTENHLKEGTGTDDKPAEYEQVTEIKTLNSMVPIWKKAKKEVTDEEYANFYKEKFMDYDDPLRVIRSSTEGAATYTALLFIPKNAPFNYYTKEYEKGLQLYSRGVLIMDKCADLLPDYFSFVKGLVDSQDLSLNISREMLQHDRQLRLIATSLEKKIKNELTAMLKNERENYEQFWNAFGLNLKYGLYSDYGTHKDVLQDLVLFHSSKEQKLVTLKEYVERMPEGQPHIYYATADTVAAADLLPQVELLKSKGYEVLYLTADIDEFALKSLREYEGKDFQNAADGDLDALSEEEKKAVEKQNEDNKELLEKMKAALDGKVKAVRLTGRLLSHPVCLSTDGGLSLEMEKVLNAMPISEKVKAERILELNPKHPMFEKLKAADEDKLKIYADILYNQALLIEGLPVEDPVAYCNEVCEVLK